MKPLQCIASIRWLCARERCTTPSWSQSRATPLGLALEQFFRYSNDTLCDMFKILSKIFWEVNLTFCDRTGAGSSRAGFTGSGRPGLGGASGPRRRRRANMGRWDWTLGWGGYNNLLAIRLKCNATLLECFVTPWKLRWVGLGEGMRSDHMVWRHTCSIIDFTVVFISSSSFQYWTLNSFLLIINF